MFSTLTDGELRTTVEEILQTAREMLEMEVAFVSRLDDTHQHILCTDGDAGSFDLAAGTALPLADTYCSRMVRGDIPNAIPDTSRSPVRRLPPSRTIRAWIGVPVPLADGGVYGSLCCADRARREIREQDVRFLRLLARLVGQALERGEAAARAARTRTQAQALRALIVALEARDAYTGDHSVSVVELAVGCARRLGLSDAEVDDVRNVALLHDIGKVGISDAVLRKPERLEDDEWAEMRRHPEIGERIIASVDALRHLAPAIRAEHERFDGSGYPDGLSGDAIPLASRIVLVCDAFHAMVSDRPYRGAMSLRAADAELERHAGTQFDPDVAAALREHLREAGALPGR